MIWPIVTMAALGYFVDIYDLILFSIVRVKSLQAIGVPPEAMLDTGVLLINMQMGGMLLGGILWGILGDKKGRLAVLLGSIFLYSIANIANAFVHTVPEYAFWRLIAGIGLAGELGAGITLVSEVMSKEHRGYGTMIVATVGILGAIAAALVGDMLDWRTAYVIGGVMGLGLLVLRFSVRESGMFEHAVKSQVKRGDFFMLFRSWPVFLKYLRCILIGVPLWFVVGILITFSPEFGKALHMVDVPSAGRAIMFTYIGLAVGDFASGCLSQLARSRKGVTAWFMGLNAVLMAFYLMNPAPSLDVFYATCFALGFASGYWALFVTIAAEQFGTNMRATVATTVPNFVRGAVVPLTLTVQALKPDVGMVQAGGIVALMCVIGAFWALHGLEETYGKDLDYSG